MIIPFRPPAFAAGVTAASALLGAAVAWHYASIDLTLSHYDARGHLIVARRIFDSLTPGWQQIGAVWLPLPHVLNALPVQVDALYRTGASGVALSILAFAVAAGSLAAIVERITGSRIAAAFGAAAFALNPNVLYLQSTPMTEPLLLALVLLGVAMLLAWCERRVSASAVGIVFALACLTRYEAWPVTASALALATLARIRGGEPWRAVLRRAGVVAAYPAAAIVAFTIMSRVVVGEWFVSGGFFVPENPALGDAREAVSQVAWGVHQLSGRWTVGVGGVGLLLLTVEALVSRSRAVHIVAIALVAAAALPLLAFYDGHPFRIRYMVSMLAPEAVGVGMLAGIAAQALTRLTPLRGGLAAVAGATFAAGLPIALDLRPLDPTAPMVLEAQWDRPNAQARRRITECLRAEYRGDTIMASMGSLGHYMQETAAAGFALRDFLHEGNGDIWLAALESPRPFAGWILVEEHAEGGDMLAERARSRPGFLDGFVRVCEGGGVALFRRERGESDRIN